MNKICTVIALTFTMIAGAQAVELTEIPYDTSMVTWLPTQAGTATLIDGSKADISKEPSTPESSLYTNRARPQMMAATNIVTTNSWLNINTTINAPSRQQWYGFLVANLALSGWVYEGYTYSFVLDGGYDGGVADTSRVEVVMCVNWADPLQTCRTLRDDSDDFTVQHDAASFSGFPVVTPNSQITYFIRVLEHVGPYQPYPYPSPVTLTISSKLYVSN